MCSFGDDVGATPTSGGHSALSRRNVSPRGEVRAGRRCGCLNQGPDRGGDREQPPPVGLDVTLADLSQAESEDLVEVADEVCPLLPRHARHYHGHP